MWSKKFWQDTTERMVRAAAASSVAFITGGKFVLDLKTNWVAVLSAAGVAALVSLILSLAGGSGVSGKPGDPSLVK